MTLQCLQSSLENGAILHSKTTLKKNEILVNEGEISENLYLVKSGALILSKNFADREQVIRLGYRGSLITTLDSFLNSIPTVFTLKSIRETTVYKFEKNTILNYFENSESTYRDFLIEIINQQTERELDCFSVLRRNGLQNCWREAPRFFRKFRTNTLLPTFASHLKRFPDF